MPSGAGGPARGRPGNKNGPPPGARRRPPAPHRAAENQIDPAVRPHLLDPAAATRRAFTLILLTLFAPGFAQLVGGERDSRRAAAGRIALKIWGGFLGVLVLIALIWFVHKEFVLGIFTHQWILRPLTLILIAAGIVWPIMVFDAWRLGRPGGLNVKNRRIAIGLTTALILITCLVPVSAGRRVWAAADLLHGVFGASKKSAAAAGRFNVLLLGGDAGPDRVGTRPDSVTLASIDANTGRTVLLSFPRNLQNIPFPGGTPAARALPNGWSCGDACLLNAIYTWGSEHRAQFPGVPDAGAEAMKQAVQGITGLKVNYYVLIDLQGFRSLIDAVGGIDIKVESKVPIGGGTSPIYGWIKPGLQHMNGFHALWYGRSREGASDYARMARQRCVMTAMLNQLDPATVLKNFQDIASAGAQVVSTDIPAGQLPGFLTLGTKAKSQKIDSVQFVPPLIVPHHPDFTVIRQKVEQAINANEKAPNPGTAASSPSTAGGTPKASGSTAPTQPAASAAATAAQTPAVDVRQVCQAA
jgi:LCP family protein required for cell wall assembly